MADRFAATLDCADIGFLPDGLLDELPEPARAGDSRIAGAGLNKPRIRAALSAALALALTRRYHIPPASARTIAALLALRDHVIAPILAGIRSPCMGGKPKIWTDVDRDHEKLGIGMHTLFRHVGIEAQPAAA